MNIEIINSIKRFGFFIKSQNIKYQVFKFPKNNIPTAIDIIAKMSTDPAKRSFIILTFINIYFN